MNLALVAGCGAGGAVIGVALDTLTGRIVRPPDPAPAEAAVPEHALVGAPAPTAPSAPVHEGGAAASRRPGRGELALSGALSGLALALLAWRLGTAPVLAADCALLCGLIAVSLVDLRIGIVPRSVLYPTFAATALGLVAASADGSQWRSLGDAAIGGVGSFAVFFALWWCFPRGIGFGDVRLAGAMGAAVAWVGFGELYVSFLAAFVLATVVGLGVMVVTGRGRKTRFALGPWLSAGAAFAILWGPWAVHLWLHRS